MLGGEAKGEEPTPLRAVMISRLEVDGYQPIGMFRLTGGKIELEILRERSADLLVRLMAGVGHDGLRRPVYPTDGVLFLEALLLTRSTYYRFDVGDVMVAPATPEEQTP
jgi:hypothetical protein